MNTLLKKLVCFCLIVVISGTCIPSAYAAQVSNYSAEEYLTSYQLSHWSIEKGKINSGKNSFLDLEDRQALEVASVAGAIESLGTFAVTSNASPQTITLSVTAKASSPVTGDVLIFNPSTNQYQSVGSINFTTQYTVKTFTLPQADMFVQADQVQVKISIQSSMDIQLSLDNISLTGAAKASSNHTVYSYDVTSVTLETGTETTSNSVNLKDRDNKYYSVSSVSNKVAWYTSLFLDCAKSSVQSLEIEYDGKTSIDANDLWISIFRFDTNNWETVAVSDCKTTASNKTVVLSAPTRLSSWISDDGEVRIRLYNSATKSFTRDTDYLHLNVYHQTAENVKKFAADTITTEYGSIIGGNETSITAKDADFLKLSSDAANKIAFQSKFNVGIAADQVYAVTVSINTSVDNSANNQYISLYNYDTDKFNVFRTSTVSDKDETLRFTVTDPMELSRYISAEGEVTARIYNSAVRSFTRKVDYVELLVEYGTFEGFEIAQISDVHELIGSSNFKSIINEINTKVQPDFTIVTGDITDHGTPEQYELYKKDKTLFTNPVYTTPGNHDVRWWNSNGKNDFKNRIGPLYQSFDHKGVHFVLLDSTVNLELDGKINKAQLEWLKADLNTIPKEMPVILFAHHPFKINNNVTARHELLNAVKENNVIAYMSGHLHYYGNVIEDGVPVNYITYVKDNPEQNYVTIRFTGKIYYIYKCKASDGSKKLWLSGTMNNTRKTKFTIESAIPDANGNVTVNVAVTQAPDGISSVKARIDNYGNYTLLTKDKENHWVGTISISDYAPKIPYGKHFVGVEVFDGKQNKWTNYMDYEWEGGSVTTNWIFETSDMIQSSATAWQDKVYVGSNDGNLYCISDTTGSLNWKFSCQDGVTSKPAVFTSNGRTMILFGSNDKKLYSVDAQSGQLNWSFTTGGSVISDPVVEGTKVVFGAGDGKIYALDASTGTMIWSYQTNGLMRQQPAIKDGVVYAFVRDTYIWYAINLEDGSLKWRGNANTDESLFVCGDVRPTIAQNKLWCIDAQNTRPGYLNMTNGVLEWTSDTIQKVSSRGMATDGSLVFYTGNNGRNLYAINAADNSTVWTADLRHDGKDGDLQEMQIDSGLIYHEGILLRVAERGRISGIDPLNGKVLFHYDAAGYPERVFWSTPEVAGNRIYISGIDGKLYSITYPK